MLRLSIGLLALLTFMQPAWSKPAQCFTTDDGYYNCDFRGIQGDGSFIISAPNRPTFTLYIDRPGVAYGVGDYGSGRPVNLPGVFYRSKQDGACWINYATTTTICAW